MRAIASKKEASLWKKGNMCPCSPLILPDPPLEKGGTRDFPLF